MEDNNNIQEKNNNLIDNKPIPASPADNASDLHDDNVATKEDMEAFIASHRKKSAAGKHSDSYLNENLDSPDPDEFRQENASADNNVDLGLEPDPQLPRHPYRESHFLSRGCSHCPQQYQPIPKTELDSCGKVTTGNWLRGIRQPQRDPFPCVEVRFKNNRKEYFRLPDGIDVSEGDVVAVEGQPGHDVGIVSLMGEVCRLQMKKHRIDPDGPAVRKLFRRAKTADIEKWAQTLSEEKDALITTRRIVEEQGLSMKVNDVEIQGDRTKAIFYYTADERVDFRNLIKILAEQFHVRVEMRQIGVRQEAGKVGGIGTCGRELCCSTWLTDFQSVTTGVAKAQQILPNPTKLAGQCGKLKCCLNFEYEVYVDATKKIPPHTPIRFQKGLALCKKTDPLRGLMWYAYEGENDMYAIPADKAREIMELNRQQHYPEKLEDYQVQLMAASANITPDENSEDYEQELRRMADSSDEKGDNQKNDDRPQNRKKNNKGPQNRQNGEDRRQQRDDRQRGDDQQRRRRDDRQHKPSDSSDAPSKADNANNPHPKGEKNFHPRNDGKPHRHNDGKPHRHNDSNNNSNATSNNANQE